MSHPSRVGLAYFAIVFAAGFALGAVREILIAPRLGGFAAVAIEIPLMLVVSWIASGWVIRTHAVPERLSNRLWMGGTAFVILMLAEAGLGILAAGRTLSEHLAAYGTIRGLLGLSAQVGFALFPAVQLWTARALR